MGDKFLQLNWHDFIKGLIVAVIAAVGKLLLDLINAKGLDLTPEDWNSLLQLALTAGGAYLLKNLFTNSKDEFGKAEPK